MKKELIKEILKLIKSDLRYTYLNKLNIEDLKNLKYHIEKI